MRLPFLSSDPHTREDESILIVLGLALVGAVLVWWLT